METCALDCKGEAMTPERLKSGKGWDYRHQLPPRTTHGMRKSLTYAAWGAMKQRCTNKKLACYPKYGGRGITVCERWMHSFENFLADVGEKPAKGYSLERVDNNKGYEPGNVIWATIKQQARNKRGLRMVQFAG